MNKEKWPSIIRKKQMFINKVLEFAQTDLGNLGAPEREGWYLNATSISKGLGASFFAVCCEFEKGVAPHEWEKIKKYQNNWLRFLDWLFDRIDEGEWKFEFETKMVFTWRGDEQIVFEADGEIIDHVARGCFHCSPIPASDIANLSIQAYKMNGSVVEKVEQVSAPAGADSFFQAISEFPVRTLIRCPHCKKLFFNSSRRQKIYCSPQCQNVSGTKRVRKKKSRKKG